LPSSYAWDRFGQRPLYYAERAPGLHVAPRADAVLRAAGIPRRLDARAAALALCDALPPQLSLFQGLSRVPPGHALLERGAAAVVLAAPALAPGGRPLLEGLRAALAELERGAACALSGGLDSSLLLALLSQTGRGRRAYTLTTEYSDAAELRAAHLLAERCEAVHVVVHVAEESLPDHVGEAVAACEEPIWNGGAVARLLFFRQLRQAGEPGLLSGAGADELLCGNPAAMRSLPARRRLARELAEELLTLRARAQLGTFVEPAQDLESLRRELVSHVLPSSTLVPECRASAAERLEQRLPYLHDAFAGAALALPAAACVRGEVGKWPLREAARGLLPEEVRCAAKVPRLAPGGGGGRRARVRWLALYDDWLQPHRLAALECVEPARARALFDDFAGARAPEPQREVQDALLLRLVSLAMLAA
jgi:asparagine synthase (glutamine-hydrolysing)